MAFWDIGFRHIVDVDGQLLAIDAELVDAASLLAKAHCPTDHELWLIRAGERFLIQTSDRVRLTRDEVLFFESTAYRDPVPMRLAA